MSTTTETIAQRFQKYLNEADQMVADRVQDDGFDSPLVNWLIDSPVYKLYLQDCLTTVGHQLMTAKNHAAREEAGDLFLSRIRGYIGAYVKSWSDAERVAFMHQVDAQAEQARQMDLAEGRDD